jgi:hypothetical protein
MSCVVVGGDGTLLLSLLSDFLASLISEFREFLFVLCACVAGWHHVSLVFSQLNQEQRPIS